MFISYIYLSTVFCRVSDCLLVQVGTDSPLLLVYLKDGFIRLQVNQLDIALPSVSINDLSPHTILLLTSDNYTVLLLDEVQIANYTGGLVISINSSLFPLY